MGTKITKSNVKSAMKDDAAHIDYLKRDILDDQKGGGKYKDINQTADEEHISKLAGDIRHDHSFLSKHWTHSSPLNRLGPLEVGKNENIDYVGNQANQQALTQSYMDQVPNDNRSLRNKNNNTNNNNPDPEKEIEVGDSPKSMEEIFRVTDEAQADLETPNKFVDIAEGEVDGVAYGAADVDGHIAIDTSTVGYDDTMNLP
tara:strand:+ start:71 stop:673 length:603 start_codon:yes stop_codon:yes gene_type:complete